MLKLKLLTLFLLIIPSLSGIAHAHTIDFVGDYRIEIGWMNEPVVSGETNAIEFYVSPLKPGLELGEQEFKNGILDLKNTVKIQLVYKDENIMLPLSPDHNIPGKYFAFVNPTIPGFYQANILGSINDTPISLSMHPPKVNDRSYIEFPEPSDLTLTQIINGHTMLIGDINDLKESVSNLEEKSPNNMEYVVIGIGIIGVIGVIIAITALVKSNKKQA